MSSIGLNTNTFRITGKYLDMLTDLIVKANINREISNIKKEQLIEFIAKIIDAENTQPQFQLLSSIIDRELRNQHNKRDEFFKTFLQEIENNNVESILPKIEFIIDALSTENSDALSKIKGD